jgi:hypothetical protein
MHVWVVPNVPVLKYSGKHANSCAQIADANAAQALAMEPSLAAPSPTLPASIVMLVSGAAPPPSDDPEPSDSTEPSYGPECVGALPELPHAAT